MEIEKIIDLKDLLKKIFLKWRIILLWMILGALALGCFGVIRKYLAFTASQNLVEEVENIEEVAASQRAELSDVEADEVDWALSAYETYTQKYKDLQAYNANSIYMKIDPYHVAAVRLDYHIQADFKEGDSEILENARRGDIRAAYIYKLQDESLYTNLAAELGENLTENNIKELVTFDSGTANLSIIVIADTKTNAEKIASYVQTAVNDMTPELQKVYGDFELASYNYAYAERVDTTIATQQQTQINSLIAMKSSITNLKNGFSDEQKAYYETCIEILDEKSEIEEETEIDKTPEEEGAVFSLNKSISLKYILVGVILGAICACLWYAILYAVSSKLHVNTEMKEYYKVSVLGNMKDVSAHTKFLFGVDKAIYSLFGDAWDPDQNVSQMNLVYEKVRLFSEKNNSKKIFISCTHWDDIVSQIVDQMKVLLKNDIMVIGCGSVNNDPDSLRKMAHSDAVILVETVGKSTYDAIKKEVEQCRDAEVPVIGCVVLE